MDIRWYGHSCFKITNNRGEAVLFDPCDPDTGYNLSGIKADIVLCSHQHHDHNYVSAVTGSPIVVTEPGEYQINGVSIRGRRFYHDNKKGALRGANTVFSVWMEGMHVLHLGDLGHIPSESEFKEIGSVDILFLPVGGVYTINAPEAAEVAGRIHPRVIIPMHYQTPQLRFRLDDLAPFLRYMGRSRIHRLNQSEAAISSESLGNRRILIFSV